MRKVILKTATGDFVTEQHVPAFNIAPDVLIWGQRFFKYQSEKDNFDTYVEVFTYAIPPTVAESESKA